MITDVPVIPDFDYLSVKAQPKNKWRQLMEKADSMQLMDLRCSYTSKLGFAILTAELVHELARICEGRTVLDTGAGSGYLSHNLNRLGINVLAVDNQSSHRFTGAKDILKQVPFSHGNAVDYVTGYDVVILSWPPYDDKFAAEIVKKMNKRQTLLYLGEGRDGCTGDFEFFSLLDGFDIDQALSQRLNAQHCTWHAMHDHWTVARPKSV